MALLTPDQHPTIADTILFDILTPGSDGCPPPDAGANNTYMVNQVTIYFVERDFTIPDSQEKEYGFQHPNASLDAAAAAAKLVACQNPTLANQMAAQQAQAYATAATATTPFYYKGVVPTAVFGTPDFPAWLRTTPDDSILQPFLNPDGSIDPGHFTLEWSPDDAREGDYFICWTWTPLPAGDQLSVHQPFYLIGDTAITTAIPTHYTIPGKYVTLLEHYLPEMFQTYLISQDITPDVLTQFHAALAKGFTDIENLANQIIDLLDANVTQEALLPYLSNLFNLKLRSNDPTLWRRQIKNAVPLFMQKGTTAGLSMALAQAGVVLNNYTPLWQVTSQYTYTDMFFVEAASNLTFTLSHGMISLDANFSLMYRPVGTQTYINLSSNYVTFVTVEGVTTMAWMGQSQSPRYILKAGDLIVVKYLVKTMPSGWQSNENYLQSLDLADQRNALDSNGNLLIPLKNWNVHVIEEDDPLFSTLIPTRQPYEDAVVFGRVRTEFAYSENIYNMDEYNGCATGDTLVITENGMKKLLDIKEDKSILTEKGMRSFSSLKSQGVKRTLDVTMKSGRKISVTPNHQFRIINSAGNLEWKRIDLLQPGDYILGKKGHGGSIPQSRGIDQSVWYLAGFVYGDGILDRDFIKWLVPEGEEESLELLENTLNQKGAKYNKFIRKPEKHQKYTHLKCNKVMTIISSSRNQLLDLGLILPVHEPKGKWKSHLPSLIWRSGEDQMCSFLRGLFDTDGTIQKGAPVLTTKWVSLAREVQSLLLLLGILSSVTSYQVLYKGEPRTYFRVGVHGRDSIELYASKIGFNLTRKMSALQGDYESTNRDRKSNNIFRSDRAVLPYADVIASSIFPTKKKMSKFKVNDRTKEEKRILCMICRLKQSYLKVIPNNSVYGIAEKASTYGVKNTHTQLLEDYVHKNWFFDEIKSIVEGNEVEVFDPINVEETCSYVSNGLISHNSLRDSLNPCDIDNNFIDACGACASSKFILDVEVQELSNDKIKETMEIITEYSPFHAILHQLNINGGVNEFITPPVEHVEFLVLVADEDNILSGNANDDFTRWHFQDYLFQLVPWSEIKRNVLAQSRTAVSSRSGTAYNSSVSLYSPDVRFDKLPISTYTKLDVISPSPNAGSYSVSTATKHTVQVSGVTEPLNQSAFTFNLSNLVYTNPVSNLSQADYFELGDGTLNYGALGVISQWDVDNQQGITSGAWQVVMTYGTFTIADISPDGNLVLSDPGRLLPTAGASNVSYTIITDASAEIASSTVGVISCRRRGKLVMSDINVSNINTLVDIGFYARYAGNAYQVIGFVPNTTNSIYIDGYTSGNASGVTVTIYDRRVNNQVGYFNYMGMMLDAGYDLETALNIQNGSNPPATVLDNDEFMESYLILINTTYYRIVNIDHNIVTLAGPPMDYKTLNAGGTSITYSVIQIVKATPVSINGDEFDVIDRRGNDLVFMDIDDQISVMAMPPVGNDGGSSSSLAINILNDQKGTKIAEIISQDEGISFKIEYLNGETEQGEI